MGIRSRQVGTPSNASARTILHALALFLAALAAAESGFAQVAVDENFDPNVELESESEILLTFSPYFWAIGLDGTAAIGPAETDISLSFTDILDDSDNVFGFMGRLTLRTERGGAYLDTSYARVEMNDLSTRIAFLNVSGDVTFKIAWIEAGASFNVFSNTKDPAGLRMTAGSTRVGVSTGIRYTRISTDVNVKTPITLDISPTQAWADPIVGLRVAHAINQRTMIGFEGDVGGFGVGTDFTWSAMALLGRRFSLGDASAFWYIGYRAIGQDYDSGSGTNRFDWDIISHGMLLGVAIVF